MKRVGNLIERIAAPDALREAYLRAARGKRGQYPVYAFAANLDGELMRIRAGLLSGTWRWGPYHRFRVYDPKERVICAAPFPDRVAQHAMMLACDACFDAYQIYDSYACRRGKGQDGALARARDYARRYQWYAKLDVRKYFDNIDHDTLRVLLRRRFKDQTLLALFDSIIASYHSAPGKGIPIGNLTSQYFANHYLAPWDHHTTENLRVSRYVRYMDDFVAWGDDKESLKAWADEARAFLEERLGLVLKPLCLQRCGHGMNFLGYRFFPHKLALTRRSRLRFKTKLRKYHALYEQGVWDENETARHVEPLIAFVRRAPSDAFPRRVMADLGLCPRARTA